MLRYTENDKKEIILKSPTGSGKTLMLCNFVNEFIVHNSGFVFVWLTPGKGDLEQQSRSKMEYYFPLNKSMILSDVLTSGFSENSISFINWEQVVSKSKS
ncbi:MAG: DEAD/DEAH box helicase family protein [Clostridiales bacterium]|nr:DEAD/DEAH box helicase family protein [Clostridiales bacterium]